MIIYLLPAFSYPPNQPPSNLSHIHIRLHQRPNHHRTRRTYRLPRCLSTLEVSMRSTSSLQQAQLLSWH